MRWWIQKLIGALTLGMLALSIGASASAAQNLPPLNLQWKLQGRAYRIQHRAGRMLLEGPGFRHHAKIDRCNAKIYFDALDGLTPRQILRRDRRAPAAVQVRVNPGSQTGYRLKLMPERIRGIMTYEQRVCSAKVVTHLQTTKIGSRP